MKSIKTYLLSLLLLTLFSATAFSQNDFYNEEKTTIEQEEKFSVTDSILVNTYFTEKDYNEMHHLEKKKGVNVSEDYYEDEIYSENIHRKRVRNTFLEDVAIEVVVEVVVNTLFVLATFWQ